MAPEVLLAWILFFFGMGFLIANVLVIADLVRFQIRKRSALLIWEHPKPRFYGLNLGLGVVFGVLIIVKLFVLHRALQQLFGEGMMFVYYGYAFPLSTRIARGFYRDGVWADSGFMRWAQISAVSWKEGDAVTLVLISRIRNVARRLYVPGHLYGHARKLLRERIKTHDIQMGGSGLGLGTRDAEDAV